MLPTLAKEISNCELREYTHTNVEIQVSLDASPSTCMPPPRKRIWFSNDLDL